MALLLRLKPPYARIDALARPKNPVMREKMTSFEIPFENFVKSQTMPNPYITARMMPKTLAALIFEEQQQGILENLKKKRQLDNLIKER